MPIKYVNIPYPDFKLHEIIDPEQFDLNNDTFSKRLNEIIELLNTLTESAKEGGSGADKISLAPIAPFTSDKLQVFLQSIIDRLLSSESGSSGSEFIGSPSIEGVTGNTISEQLYSLKSLFDMLKSSVNTSIANKIGRDEVYTKNDVDKMALGLYRSVIEHKSFTLTEPSKTLELPSMWFNVDVDHIKVFVNGVYQTRSFEYAPTSKEITFNKELVAGTMIDVEIERNKRIYTSIENADINKAIGDSSTAKAGASQAIEVSSASLEIARVAKIRADESVERANAIIASTGDDNTEIVDGRLRSDGTVAPTLGVHIREIEQLTTNISIDAGLFGDSRSGVKIDGGVF